MDKENFKIGDSEFIFSSELLNKPILNCGLSRIPEEDEKKLELTPKRRLNEAFKRPSPRPPLGDYYQQPKRAKSVFIANERVELNEKKTTILSRAHSESAIITAVERINSDPNLVGDGSKAHILPIVQSGKHTDLKEISPSVLVALMNGQYSGSGLTFEVIDCRYPYEFNGGHIKDAINIYRRAEVYERFFGSKVPLDDVHDGKRHIIIFHCEFSSQRAPDMCRYVRDCDRKMNEYPKLHYPELYILFGGYKAFYEEHKSYCIPQVYLTMVDTGFVEQCRHFKALSKADKKSTPKSQQGKIVRATSMKKLCLDNL